MSQANTSFKPSSSELPNIGASQMNECRWAWCRLTFTTNANLVHHVIQEHVRKAVRVRRRDISMLRRAEEGLGESLSISGIIGRSHGGTSEDYLTGRNEVMMQDTSSSPMQSGFEFQLPSSLPSPPASSPIHDSPILLSGPIHALQLPSTPSARDTLEGWSQNGMRVDSGAFPAATIGDAPFTPPSAKLTRNSCFGNSTTQSNSNLGQIDIRTPTFASLSSPMDSPSMPPLPVSPSFNALVADAVSTGAAQGARIDRVRSRSRIQDRDRFQHLSQDSQNSQLSCDMVEQQLTQSQDMHIDTDTDIDAIDHSHVVSSSSGSSSSSKERESSLRYSPNQGQPDMNPFAAESKWPSPEESVEQNLRDVIKEDTHLQSQPKSQPQLQLQLKRLPAPSPTVVRTPVQRQAWYQASLPVRRDKSRASIQARPVSGNRTGSSSSGKSQTSSQFASPPQSGFPSPERQNRSQSPGHISGTGFRSGSLQISQNKEVNVVSVSDRDGSGVLAHGETQSLLQSAHGDWPQSHPSQVSSGSPSQSSANPYAYLQTQAPYRSQSLSQS